jgi:hypothetical protein
MMIRQGFPASFSDVITARRELVSGNLAKSRQAGEIRRDLNLL